MSPHARRPQPNSGPNSDPNAAVQAVCRDAAASASVLTHTLDCALRTQLLLRGTVLEGRVSVRCAAWAATEAAEGGGGAEEAFGPPGQPLVLVGPDGEEEPEAMRAARQQAAAGGAALVLLNHRPAKPEARFSRPRFLGGGGGRRPWSPGAGVEIAYEIVPLVLRKERYAPPCHTGLQPQAGRPQRPSHPYATQTSRHLTLTLTVCRGSHSRASC